MFSFSDLFGKKSGEVEIVGNLYNLDFEEKKFVDSDLFATYSKILTDTLERTSGISDEHKPLLWDNCLANEVSNGLVSLLAKAMVDKAELFLVYVKSVNVLRIATAEERTKIQADYLKNGKSPLGVSVSFKSFTRTDMLKLYGVMEYYVLASLNKNVRLSSAIQIKINELRKSVSMADAAIAKEQAKEIADALKKGKDIYCDSNDSIVTPTPDIEPTEKAINFLDSKRAYYLDVAKSYVSGDQTPGIGTTGEADMRANERGFRGYFFSIVRPILMALFDYTKLEFVSQDFRQATSATEMLKAFELASNELISKDSQQRILARMFELNPQDEKKQIEKEKKDISQANTVSRETDDKSEDDEDDEDEPQDS